MSINVLSLDNKSMGTFPLPEKFFDREVRWDLIHGLFLYSNAKRQAGTHSTKTISDISGTGKKPFAQKGTGRARQGSLRSAQMRGGATAFGPVPRSHAFSLNKKYRKQALLSMLAAKYQEGKVVVIDHFDFPEISTKLAKAKLAELGYSSALFVDGVNLNPNFYLSTRNLSMIDCISQDGLNVYALLKHEHICFSKAGLEQFIERITDGKK